MDSQTILKVNLEDLPDDQKAIIEQAAKEFREKCLLSYSRTRDSIVQRTPLLSVLLHGQSEDVEARTTTHLVYKTIHEAFTNHNKVLTNTIGNVLKDIFFVVPVDQVGLAYSNVLNPSTVGSNIPGSSQQPNGAKFQQPPIQQLLGGQAQDQTLQIASGQNQALPAAGGKVKPY